MYGSYGVTIGALLSDRVGVLSSIITINVSELLQKSEKSVIFLKNGKNGRFPHFNKTYISWVLDSLHRVFHSFNMVFHISTVE